MLSRHWNQRRLGFEALEDRQYLAGNVTAGIDVNGNVTIAGDLADNHVAIYRGTFGQIVVAGGTSTGDASGRTRINGQFIPVTLNANGGVILNMRSGNDRVLLTNITLTRAVNGSLGLGNDQLLLHSGAAGAVPFVMNNGGAAPYGKVAVQGLLTVNGNEGNDTFSFYNANVAGGVTLTGGVGNDSVLQSGTVHNQNIVGGNFRFDGNEGDDLVDLRRLTLGSNLFINDGAATIGSTVTLTNLRVNLDIQLFLSIGNDLVRIQGEDNANNRFRVRDLILFTGDTRDDVLVSQGVMENLTVDTGAGEEGNGYFGVTLADLAINRVFQLDLGTGFDNAFLDNISADSVRVFGRAGSDGIIAQQITATDALFDSDTADDVIGLYDSTYSLLNVVLFDGNDQLYAGGLTVNTRARFNGGFGFNTFNDQGGNDFAVLERSEI